MLPLADALDKTGGTDIVVGALMQGVGDIGPYGMMTVLFFLTAALGLFSSVFLGSTRTPVERGVAYATANGVPVVASAGNRIALGGGVVEKLRVERLPPGQD